MPESKKGSKKTSKKGSKKTSKTVKKHTKSIPTKGDCRCYYKGSEPSPKGLGYCAHCGKEGMTKFGRDGLKWVITRRENGSMYWKKK